ncbi:MAG: hypothetical protein KIT15_02415 [Xanthobacteraceae bacterium]|nr:hypothetical protein [Xanthobacteraceae bacterium]
MAFVFYDTETTGVETSFDQILQFAAIKTDNDLTEIDSINLRCRILPHIVPSPGALTTTGVHPSELMDSKLPSHYAAIRVIRAKLMEWSPAIFAGWNSMDFDEELLRQALFQTLHLPYLTNTRGNARADIMKMALAATVYHPGSLQVPQDEKGKPRFKLELLAAANGFKFIKAHDALDDVRATIHVARLLKERAPDIWERMITNSNKRIVTDQIRSASQFSWTERYFGTTYSWLVTACGSNPNNAGQTAVFDLAFNPDEYVGLSVEELVGLLNAKQKVIRSIKTNAQPIVMPAKMSPVTAKALAIPLEERQRRIAVIANNHDFQARVGQALVDRFKDEPESIYIEDKIYAGFANEDEPNIDKFHEMEWAARHLFSVQFKDDRIKHLSARLLYFEHPDGMADETRTAMNTWLRERVTTEEEVPWMTIPKALAEAREALNSVERDKAELLRDTMDFLADMNRRVSVK